MVAIDFSVNKTHFINKQIPKLNETVDVYSHISKHSEYHVKKSTIRSLHILENETKQQEKCNERLKSVNNCASMMNLVR